MANISIAVINASTVLTDTALRPMVDAVQQQIHTDFAPLWGMDADLVYVPQGGTPDPSLWWLAVMDDSDSAGALGYHDVTSAGLPLGKVFAKTDLDNGYAVSVTLSHELLEMLADPDINLTVQLTGSQFYAYEVCDPVEADVLGYQVGGIQVSDFVLPAYFETFLTTGQFDFTKHLSGVLPALAPGGYVSYFDATDGQWHQITARTRATDKFLARPRLGSRRSRRRLNRDEWLLSDPVRARLNRVDHGADAPGQAVVDLQRRINNLESRLSYLERK